MNAKVDIDKAAIEWARLQEELNANRQNRHNPNDDFKNLTAEERKARIYVKITSILNDLKAEK